MGLILECTRSGERGFLDLDGSLDDVSAGDLKRRAVQLIATGCNELVINLERVFQIQPAGVEALARIEAMLPAGKSALTIQGPAPQIRHALDAAGLGGFVQGLEFVDYSAEQFGFRLVSSTT